MKIFSGAFCADEFRPTAPLGVGVGVGGGGGWTNPPPSPQKEPCPRGLACGAQADMDTGCVCVLWSVCMPRQIGQGTQGAGTPNRYERRCFKKRSVFDGALSLRSVCETPTRAPVPVPTHPPVGHTRTRAGVCTRVCPCGGAATMTTVLDSERKDDSVIHE